MIVTIPPYAPFLAEIAAQPHVSAGRLNTIMPLAETKQEVLRRLARIFGSKPIWIDLKCRQLRTTYGRFYKEPTLKVYGVGGSNVILDPERPRTQGQLRTPPWSELEISHEIYLDLSHGPVVCWFQDGRDKATIAAVEGRRLIMLDGPQRIVGGGESINILDDSLKIKGFLTEVDREYIAAARDVGIHTYMLSYVEEESDIIDLLNLDPEAEITAKIESAKGLQWVNEIYPKYKSRVRLMAARGDLYVEVGEKRPDKIIGALRKIISADSNAIVASRILGSLLQSARPTCADITDVAYLYSLGYQELMIGDELCFEREKLLLAIDMAHAIGESSH